MGRWIKQKSVLPLANRVNIQFIQAMLDHFDLSTIKIYTRGSIKQLREVHGAMRPARPETKNSVK